MQRHRLKAVGVLAALGLMGPVALADTAHAVDPVQPTITSPVQGAVITDPGAVRVAVGAPGVPASQASLYCVDTTVVFSGREYGRGGARLSSPQSLSFDFSTYPSTGSMLVKAQLYRCSSGVDSGTMTQVTATIVRTKPVFLFPVASQSTPSGSLLVGPKSAQPTQIMIDGQLVRSWDLLTSVGGRSPALFHQVRVAGLTPGTHSVQRVRCKADSTGCNISTATAPVPFVVGPVRPFVSPPKVWLAAFSPNGDGRGDTAKVDFTLDRPGTVEIRVTDPWHRTVRGPVRVNGGRVLAAGAHSWTWDGGGPSRTGLDGRTCLFDVRATSTLGGKSVTGRALGMRKIDLTPPNPNLGSITNSVIYRTGSGPRSVYLNARVGTQFPNEATGGRSWVRVRDAAGRVVYDEPMGNYGNGWRQASWDGYANGAKVRAGRYFISVRAEDWAGNRAESKRFALTVR